jgi:hypothetical protein
MSIPKRRVAQFALPLPSSGATVFRRDSFDLARSAQRARRFFLCGSRWLLTPCALRLREPHLTA